MKHAHFKGFTLLEFLLAMALGVALIASLAAHLHRSGSRFAASADRVEFALMRARLVQLLEGDLINADQESLTTLPSGASWSLRGGTKYCAYIFEGGSRRLHRILSANKKDVTDCAISERTALVNGVEEFSIGYLDDDEAVYVLDIRFSGEPSKFTILFAP